MTWSRFSVQCQCNVSDMHISYRYKIIKISWRFFQKRQFDERGYCDFCDHDNSTNIPCRAPPLIIYPGHIKAAVCSKHRHDIFHPDFSYTWVSESQPAGRREYACFLRVETRSRHFALTGGKSKRQRCVYTVATRVHGRVQWAHPRTPIPIHMSVQPDTDAHTCASESRPRRQVPFTHTLARKQIPGLSRIYWNNLGKYDKFGYEICRRACELSAPVSASLPRSLPPSSPPLSASSPFLSYPFNPTLLLYLFVLLATTCTIATRHRESPRPTSSDICSKSVQ